MCHLSPAGTQTHTSTLISFLIQSNKKFLGGSVQFSCSVVSDSLQLHESQHTRPPYPSPAPGVHPNPCPLSRHCHPTISSSVVPFFSCPQSFPASGSFPMSQLSYHSVQFSRSVVSDSLRPHELQHARPPCPSPAPGVHPNPCPSSR